MFEWGPDVSSPDKQRGVRQSILWREDGENHYLRTDKLDAEDPATIVDAVEWMGVKSAYFVVAFKPENVGDASAWYEGVKEDFRFGMAVPRSEVAADEALERSYQVYIGPSKLSALAAAWPTLDSAPRFFESSTWAFMDKFSKLLLRMLNFFYGVIPNYGVAIILLTVVVRLCMLPLTLKSMKSMKMMQQLAPEIEEIREKYKDDNQEQQKRIMEMYRERGVNPLGGCLPMLLQMPVFIALYRMLWSTYELRGAPFILWIQDLSQPDHLFHTPFLSGIPFIGQHLEYFNLLPFLMGASMVISQKVLPQSGPATNPQQKTMMTIMPIFFSVVCYKMASGLNLYIFVSTVLGIGQQALTRMYKDVDVSPKKKMAPRRKRHFYDAAQARKKRMAKEHKPSSKKGSSARSGGGKGTPKR